MKNFKIIIAMLLITSSLSFSASQKLARLCKFVNGIILICDSKISSSSLSSNIGTKVN